MKLGGGGVLPVVIVVVYVSVELYGRRSSVRGD